MNERLRLAIFKKNAARQAVLRRCEYQDCMNKACCVSFQGLNGIALCSIHGAMAEKDRTEEVVWSNR